MTTAVLPACRPHADLVDALRMKLPPQCLDLAAICALLAISETIRPDDSEVLAALLYLERRGEIQRSPRKGWRKVTGCQPVVTCLGPQGSRQMEAQDAHVTTAGAATSQPSGPGLFPLEIHS